MQPHTAQSSSSLCDDPITFRSHWICTKRHADADTGCTIGRLFEQFGFLRGLTHACGALVFTRTMVRRQVAHRILAIAQDILEQRCADESVW
jgi:hypothetical protein